MPSLSFRLNAVKLKTSFFSCVLLAWSGWLVVVSQTESTVCIVSSSPAVLSQTYILICSTVAISPLPYMFRCEQLRLAVLIVSASSLTYCNFLQFRRHLLLFSLDAWGFSPPPPSRAVLWGPLNSCMSLRSFSVASEGLSLISELCVFIKAGRALWLVLEIVGFSVNSWGNQPLAPLTSSVLFPQKLQL